MNQLTMQTNGIAKTVANRSSRLVVKATASKPTAESSPPSKEFCGGLVGNSAPMGDFDPLNISAKASMNKVKLFREAEVTHGRVSMLASLGFIVGENFNPFFDESIKGPAIGHFQQLPATFWTVVLGGIGLAEFARLTKGWVSPAEGKGLWTLKDDYLPGDLGFDPLGLRPTDAAELEQLQLRELNNGRLAMFGIAGMVAQELVTGKELFNLEDDGLLNDANCPPGIICEILETSG